MVYALVLGTSVERHASSSLALGTKISGQWPVFSYQLKMLNTGHFHFPARNRKPKTKNQIA